MSEDDQYGEFWNVIYSEYKTSKRLLLKLTGYSQLMEEEPAGKASIAVRESIVLPLLTIQQFALKKIQELEKEPVKDVAKIAIYQKLVMRSLFGNINASRNAGEIKAVIVAAAINLRLSIGLQYQRLITAGAFKIVAG